MPQPPRTTPLRPTSTVGVRDQLFFFVKYKHSKEAAKCELRSSSLHFSCYGETYFMCLRHMSVEKKNEMAPVVCGCRHIGIHSPSCVMSMCVCVWKSFSNVRVCVCVCVLSLLSVCVGTWGSDPHPQRNLGAASDSCAACVAVAIGIMGSCAT